METHLLIDRYLLGSLDELEMGAFEERLVWDHDLIDELDLAERLRDGLRVSVASGNRSADAPRHGIMNLISGILAVPQYAAAASFLLAIALSVGILNSSLMSDANDVPAEVTPMPTEIVPLMVVRGETANAVTFRKDTTTVLLVDAGGFYESYRVTVRKDTPDAKPVFSQDQLSVTYPDSIAVNIPRHLLTSGPHILTVEAFSISDTGEHVLEQIRDVPFEATVEE